MIIPDIHGLAILDYYNGQPKGPLLVNNHYGPAEEMPLEVFFRTPEAFSDLEHYALSLVRGKILDVGAGAGAHTLYLQSLGHDITALETSSGCVSVMEKQQVKQRIQTNIYQFREKGYDTIYLLMNGIGIAGTLNRLPAFLKHLTSLLKPGGQLLFDSSDISYLYVGKDKPRNYYGEVRYQYKYNEEKGLWFNWLYVDPQTLMDVGQKHHFNVQVISEDDTGQYLARVNV